MVSGTLLRFESMMNLILYLIHSVLKGENPTDVILLKKSKHLLLACISQHHLAFTDRFLSNLVWWQGLLCCTFWDQFRRPWFSLKVTIVWETKNFGVHFLRNFAVDLDEISVCCYNLLVYWSSCKIDFAQSTIQGTELCWRDFIKYTIDIVLSRDTCEPIYIKLGILLHTT